MLNYSVVSRSSQVSRSSLHDTYYSSPASSIFEGSVSQATARTTVLNLNIFDGGADHAPQFADVLPNIGGFVHAEPAPFPNFFMPQQHEQGIGNTMFFDTNIADVPNFAMQQHAADENLPQNVIGQSSSSQSRENLVAGLFANLRERVSANSAAERDAEQRVIDYPVSNSDDNSTVHSVSLEIPRNQDGTPASRGDGQSTGNSLFSRLRRFMRRRSGS